MTRFLKFYAIGGLSYLLNIGGTYVLIEVFLFSVKTSYAVTLLVVTAINFLGSLKLVFGSSFSWVLFLRYLGALLFYSLVNYFLVQILYHYNFGNLYFLIFGVSTIVSVLKFFTYQHLVFSKPLKKG